MEKLIKMLGKKLFTQYRNLLLDVDKSCFTVNDPMLKSFRETTVGLLEEILDFDLNQLTIIKDLVNSLKTNSEKSNRPLAELIFKKKVNDPLLIKIIETSHTLEALDQSPTIIASELSICRKTVDRKADILKMTGAILIRKVQLYKVKVRLLKLSTPTSIELLRISGYSSIKALNRDFKAETGLTPFEYREKYLH